MNTSHAKWALIATTALLGVPCNAMAADGDSRTSSIQLTHEIAKEAVSYGDLNAMAAAIGIDYPVLLERAVSKKPAAVFLLLWMAGNAPLDGAGAEGYTYTMVRAAKAIGDDILSVATQKLDASAQQAVIEAFLFEYGGTDEPEQAASEVSKAFPKLWAAIRKRQGEQAGTGQPATTFNPQSKPRPRAGVRGLDDRPRIRRPCSSSLIR